MLVLLCRCAGFVSTLVMSICWFCKNTRCNDVCFASVHHQTYRCFSHIPCTFLSPHKSFVSVIFHASIHQHTICCLSPYSARVLSSHIPLFQSYSMQVFITTQSVVSVIFHACVIITYTVVSVIFHASVHHYTYRCFSHTPCSCSSLHIPLFQSYSMQLFITTHTVVSGILHAAVHHYTYPLFQSYSMQLFITTHTVVSFIFHATIHHHAYPCFSHTPCNYSSPRIPLFQSYSMQLFITTHARCFVHTPCNYSSPRIPLFQSYSMQVYFRQRWRDDRLQYNMTNVTQFTLSNRFMNHIWKPPTYFLNGRRSKLHNITVPNEFVRIESNGNIYMSKR